MKVDKNTLEGLAHLSRLEIKEEKQEQMVSNLNQVIEWVGKLDELDTKDVKPLTHMSEEIDVYRQDEVKVTLTHNQALVNAPKKDSNYFRVPKVVD